VTEPLIYSVGTQVVVQKDTYHVNKRVARPAGSVGVIVRSPIDRTHSYRVKFNDGFEAAVYHDQLVRLSEFKRDHMQGSVESSMIDLNERVIYRCVIGSRAYGLEEDQSDTDRRGIYLPNAERHWSLYGVPEQLENEETQEAPWIDGIRNTMLGGLVLGFGFLWSDLVCYLVGIKVGALTEYGLV